MPRGHATASPVVATRFVRRWHSAKRPRLVVSAGRSPAAFMAALSCQSLDWSRVTVTLADGTLRAGRAWRQQRRHTLKSTLLAERAARARFVAPGDEGLSPEVAAKRAAERLDDGWRDRSTWWC